MISNNNNNILIVDDEISCVTSLELMIDRTKYNVFKAHGGKEALQYLLNSRHSTDIILLDLLMPDLDGVTLLKMMREAKLAPSAHIIIQTACVDTDEIKLALTLGAQSYLLKPFNKIDLDNCLADIANFGALELLA